MMRISVNSSQIETPADQDRRLDDRLYYRADVLLNLPGLGFVKGTSRDISSSGLFVETNSRCLPVRATGSLVLSLSPKVWQTLEARARVVHCSADGCGLEFLKLTSTDQAALTTLLASD